MEKKQITDEQREKIVNNIFQVTSYFGALLLTLFLIEYSISSEMFAFLQNLSNPKSFCSMLSVFVVCVATVLYENSTEKKLSFSYIVMIVVSVVSVAVFGNGSEYLHC